MLYIFSDAVVGFLMALGNAWGLTLAMAFLGHGLVQLPRSLWKSANHKNSLTRLEVIAPKRYEQMLNAQADLDSLVAEIQGLPQRPIAEPSLEALAYELINECPLPTVDLQASLAEQAGAVDNSVPVTRETLVNLRYRLKEAISHLTCTKSKWQSLTRKAIHLQDVLINSQFQTDHLWSSTFPRPNSNRWFRLLRTLCINY